MTALAGSLSERVEGEWDHLYALVLFMRSEAGDDHAVDVDDWRDVQSTLGGDDRAYARIVDRYQSAISAFMWKFVRSREMHEELVQRVFVEAYFSLDSFRGEGSLLGWLRTIGTRVGYRWWKEKGKQPGEEREALDKAVEEASCQAADEMGPEQAAELLHRLLQQLDAQERLVLTLFYLEECSMREVGRHLGCSEDAAKMRVHRAREKLRGIVKEKNLAEDMQWML